MIEFQEVSQAKKGPIKTLATKGNKSENSQMLKKRIGVVMLFGKKTGFTLIELLVVMSIIGVLSAALITQVTKMRETARAMKCKANLRNLAQAALNYGVDHSIMPWAGSHEYVNARRTSGGFVSTANLRRGWVDWTFGDKIEAWPKDYSSGSSFSAKGKMQVSMAGKAGYLSVTNGVLWSYMGKDISSYVCESHKSMLKGVSPSTEQVYRSYFMNGYFGYNKDYAPLTTLSYRDVYVKNLSSRGNASILLLFAEVPIIQSDVDSKLAMDGVLETVIVDYNDGVNTRTPPQREVIGFNHMVGRRYVAHVAFADGHVDVLHSIKVTDPTYYKKWAGYLCNGVDLPKDSSTWKIPPDVP